MNTLLVQIDGKIPNLALMRIAAFHRRRGDDIKLVFGRGFKQLLLWDNEQFDKIYASAIFEWSRPVVAELLELFPDAEVGGTGWHRSKRLQDINIFTSQKDYTIYPRFRQSIGFTQRGCRLKCPFCVVPEKEGEVRFDERIEDIWRGDPWPSELLLLDNDFFGSTAWRQRIQEIRDGNFKVSFNQGINARFLTDEAAEAIASVDYRDDSMQNKRIYTAWDNRQDEDRLFAGLKRLVKYGVKPDHIMVYMLIGYWQGERVEHREHRRRKLREFGARPYPMPFVRTPELVGFQRWVIGAYDKRISWTDWAANNYRPEGLKPAPTESEALFS